MRFLLDESTHRSVAQVLQQLGHEVVDGRDVGLRGKPDRDVFKFAQSHQAILLTADLDFSDTLVFPLGSHQGIVVLRFPSEVSTITINNELLASLSSLTETDLRSNLTVISPGKVRIRRKH